MSTTPRHTISVLQKKPTLLLEDPATPSQTFTYQRASEMAEEQKEKPRVGPRTIADITPQQDLEDSFSSDAVDREIVQHGKASVDAAASATEPSTPPVSPAFKAPVEQDANATVDPLLFAHGSGEETRPLFSPESPMELPGESYLRTTRHTEPLTTIEPEPLQTYPAILNIRAADEAHNFYDQCCDELRQLNALRRLPAPPQVPSPRAPADTQVLSKLTKPAGVSKPRATPKVPVAKVPAPTTTPSTPKTPAAPKRRAPKQLRVQSEQPRNGSPAAGAKYTRRPPTKSIAAGEGDWKDLPDYSPPLSTLDGDGAKKLSAKWESSGPKPPADDPDLPMLHAQELELITNLRMPLWKYMDAKRRIFMRRVDHLKGGKPFTKTHAQDAAHRDVNKLSRLFVAFDRAGWFEPKHFQQYL